MSVTKYAKAILKSSPFYSMCRNAVGRYRLNKARRNFWLGADDAERPRVEFYKQFVSPGSLVFDVGANLGNRSRVFWRLGATVIAVEPQPACAGVLRSVFDGRPRFTLVEAALGAEPGQAEMMVSNAHTVSSLSPDWVQTVRESGRFPECDWSRKQVVTLDTLDGLISRYGRPAFIKIDVEGFEDQVLAGLSQPVGALSIEYTPEFEKGTQRCIEHVMRLGDARFQLSLGESMQWEWPEWVDGHQLRKALHHVPADVFGDMYARFAM